MKIQEILILANHYKFSKGFPCLQRYCYFQKRFIKELIFVALSLALLVENLSSMSLKTGLWSVKSPDQW